MSEKRLIKRLTVILEERGKPAYEVAKKEILNEKIEYKPVRDALRYFMEELWHNFQHPALLSLACESVGGKAEEATPVGAALVLLTGAADIHDDILDQSQTKQSKLTVFGKFGTDIAVLTGDVLLLKGLTLLYGATQLFPRSQRRTVADLIKKTFFEIGTAAAREANLKKKWDLTAEEYWKLIEMKAGMPDAIARVGAMLGRASPTETEALGKYGRIFGILAIVREEFINVFEPEELRNRAENECLPLPILYAMRQTKAANEIKGLLRRKGLTEEEALKIAEITMNAKEIQVLRVKMKSLLEEGVTTLQNIKNRNVSKTLAQLLRATIADLC